MRSVVILLVLAVLLLTGCGETQPPGDTSATGEWSLQVVVGENTTQMTMEQITELADQEIEFLSKETGTTNLYQGVPLKDLCEAAGADPATIQSVEVEAEDGFLAILDQNLATSDGVFLVTQMDGGPLPDEMGHVRMLAPGEATKYQVKMVKRVIVK